MRNATLALLTTSEMAAADRFAIDAGIPGIALMERAGLAVAEVAQNCAAERGVSTVTVLCGPGKNGGDGLVAARILRERGLRVRVGLLDEPASLTGDAAIAFKRWGDVVATLAEVSEEGADIYIDALFGAGLSRALEGDAAKAVQRMNASGCSIITIDVPSGLDGNTGLTDGPAVRASRTVTFFRLKPGHLLLPGRDLCGAITLADIGIPAASLDTIGPAAFENAPDLWSETWPIHGSGSHKFTRGAVAVLAGGVAGVGAPRLSARAALRTGAGLVTIHCAPAALAVHAARGPDAVMQRSLRNADGLQDVLNDRRLAAVLAGPALGLDRRANELIEALAECNKPTVFDADALTLLARSDAAFAALKRRRTTVLTPHEGEFHRLFGKTAAVMDHTSKLERARAAASLSGAVIVYKGADTVIAAPDGRAAVNTTGSFALATAGTGDVLAGLVTGLIAQGMPAFEAAAAAVWLHGRAGETLGSGLIADDLPEAVAALIRHSDRFDAHAKRPAEMAGLSRSLGDQEPE